MTHIVTAGVVRLQAILKECGELRSVCMLVILCAERGYEAKTAAEKDRHFYEIHKMTTGILDDIAAAEKKEREKGA